MRLRPVFVIVAACAAGPLCWGLWPDRTHVDSGWAEGDTDAVRVRPLTSGAARRPASPPQRNVSFHDEALAAVVTHTGDAIVRCALPAGLGSVDTTGLRWAHQAGRTLTFATADSEGEFLLFPVGGRSSSHEQDEGATLALAVWVDAEPDAEAICTVTHLGDDYRPEDDPRGIARPVATPQRLHKEPVAKALAAALRSEALSGAARVQLEAWLRQVHADSGRRGARDQGCAPAAATGATGSKSASLLQHYGVVDLSDLAVDIRRQQTADHMERAQLGIGCVVKRHQAAGPHVSPPAAEVGLRAGEGVVAVDP